VFSNPTQITNPLFPISELASVVLLGEVDGMPFRAETTLLPETGVVVWDGEEIEVLLSQYVAYLDGEIQEVAIDRYAQADDGAVWYLGEDVYDYENGAVAVSEGTWLVGRDGPPAMIMPAAPTVGDVFRPENIPGIIFEEVQVKAVDQTVDGPTAPSRVRWSPRSYTSTEPIRKRSSLPATASSTPLPTVRSRHWPSPYRPTPSRNRNPQNWPNCRRRRGASSRAPASKTGTP